MSQNGESPSLGTPARVRRRGTAGVDAPGTPAAAGSPRGSPGSAASASPAFARTPRSGGGSPAPAPSPAPATPGPRREGSASVAMSPAADSPGSPESAGAVRTPTARPGVRSSPAPSASPPWARTPGSGRRDAGGSPVPSRRSDPAASPASSRRGPRVAPHRGFLGTTPAREPGRGGAPDFDENAADLDLEEGTYLYGTDIKEAKVVVEVHKFIRNFRVPETQGERSHYLQQLDKMWDEASNSAQRQKGIKFPILGTHIHDFSPTLYGNLVNFPTEVIPIFDRELWNISVRELAADPESIGVCQVQVHSLMERDSKIMRNMNPSDIEKLITIKGIVIRCSDLVPDMMSAVFRCTVEDCKHEEAVALSHWTIEEPTRCESCGGKRTFQIVHNECTFMDKQVLKLQETPELVPEGETPQNVAVTCHEDLVDQVRPGDRVEVTGIFRASAVKPMANFKQHNAVYRTYVDAIAIYTESKGRIDQPQEDLDTLLKREMPKLSDKKDLDQETNTEEEIRWNLKVRELAQAKDESGVKTIVSRLVQSFAPSIFEEDEVKKGLLCQLFGGTPKPLNSTTKGKCRPEINTLLCGDPSTAKSQLMQYAYKLAPRGVYTSGKGSSAVGLTASINKDPATGELVLESGALVLADRGVCCIDEFDKMDENARAILHEAMEQQTVSVAKAGIVCSLNARSSILASANPKDSAYDPKMSIVENINLPKNLMTRFDFIWLMLDKRQKDTDRRLAEHLISMYSVSGARRRVGPSIDSETFRRYVSFAKRWIFPRLTDEAEASLVKGYIDLRNQGSSREAITATPRILECLIRTSESLAKMELREEVSTADVEESIRLLKAATYAAAVDPETGLIDMEQLIVGMGAARRKRNKELEQLVQDIVAEHPDQQLNQEQVKATMNERLGERKEQLASEKEFSDALRAVEQAGLIRRQGKMLEARAS